MASQPDDATLMLRYRDGDLKCFEALYTRHRGPLYRFLLRHSRDPDKAAELYTEVWNRVIKSRFTYEPRVRFEAYLYQIAHHCYVDNLRRQSRPAEAEAPAESAAGAAEAADTFPRVLATLPAQQREALLMQQEAGLTVSEISRITGASVAEIQNRLGYAARKLSQTLPAGGT